MTRSIPSHSSSSTKLHRLPLKSLVSRNRHRSQELGVASHMIFSSKGVICPPFAWLLLPCNLCDSSSGEEMTILFSITWKKTKTKHKKKQRNSKLADQGRVVQSGLDVLKIIKKTIRLNVFEQNINKPGLEFNLGLVLIVLRTYWAWCLLNTTKKEKKNCIRFRTSQVLGSPGPWPKFIWFIKNSSPDVHANSYPRRGTRKGGGWNLSPEFLICSSISKRFSL